jgi:hypothetical protein
LFSRGFLNINTGKLTLENLCILSGMKERVLEAICLSRKPPPHPSREQGDLMSVGDVDEGEGGGGVGAEGGLDAVTYNTVGMRYVIYHVYIVYTYIYIHTYIYTYIQIICMIYVYDLSIYRYLHIYNDKGVILLITMSILLSPSLFLSLSHSRYNDRGVILLIPISISLSLSMCVCVCVCVCVFVCVL